MTKFTILDTYTLTGETIESASISNSGQVVGDAYNNATGAPTTFVENLGQFTMEDPQFAEEGGPTRINDNGNVVTSYDGVVNLSTGVTTRIDPSPGEYMQINAVNDTGGYGGYYHGQDCIYEGGKMTMVNFPGATGILPGAEPGGEVSTSIYSLNDNGQAVGIYNTTLGVQGFLYSKGQYSTIHISGATYTDPTGINDAGEIVGYYKNAAGVDNGFIDIGGNIQTYIAPGGSDTIISGLNNLGQIVGVYDNSSGQHMFVGYPSHSG